MDDDNTDSPSPRPRRTRDLPLRRAKIKAPARETRSTAAYFTSSANTQTSSSSSTESTDTDDRPLTRTLRPIRNKRKSSAPATPATPAKSARSIKRQRVQPPAGGTSLLRRQNVRSKNAVDDSLLDNSLVCLPWHSLPYHVWLRVFDFVAAPIRDPASRADDLAEAVGTLISGARTCRSTAEPALAALYTCPPFRRAYTNSPQTTFVRFLETLALPPSKTLIRYRPKVEILRIDVDALLSRKVNGLQLQLHQVIKNLPRLSCLELYHPLDDAPYRDLSMNLRWKLSKDDLLNGLTPPPDGDSAVGDKTTTTSLKSWRWNSRLAPTDLSLDRLQEMHALPGFQSLRKLAYVNYQLPSMTQFSARARNSQEAQNSDLQAIVNLAASISALPDLQHLVIESSTLANGSLLERLPKTLKHLELVNCWEVTSEDLSAFLMSHGNSLVHLTLKHCQSLSLGFLPVLATSCPNLAHLEMDLSYFRHHESYADNKPEYATLLEVDQVPTWPSSIQSIEIIHMRNWSRAAAEMFFGSLMKNAKALPNLRRLEFKVILNIEWRQRQEMRRSLADQMTRVFKRKQSSPKEQKTLHQYDEMRSKSIDETDMLRFATRRSSRIIYQSSKSVSNKDGTSASGKRNLSQALPTRRSLKSLKAITSTFDADDEESSEDELSQGHVNTRRNKSRTATAREAGLRDEEFIHGLCDIVDIQVDNQRPAERQYDMDDFLDSPEQSDPEWNSDEDDVLD
ncbi:hypothetical protein FHL15_009821 [Xylaria flabelliformis]|uniref:F-box domain-containing protein n=1 Tax=Xylaria flabelliformis TaxID=2512241 RepID=A0A553HMR7_9PEZI|nr:hypothetical protein FHL15_009821 [Xylaria flabelliformis]